MSGWSSTGVRKVGCVIDGDSGFGFVEVFQVLLEDAAADDVEDSADQGLAKREKESSGMGTSAGGLAGVSRLMGGPFALAGGSRAPMAIFGFGRAARRCDASTAL
jgi:hypothetical protein